METWVLILCCIVCLFCVQSIYIQVKRQGFVLICYSITNSLICISFVISGIFLHDDFLIETATQWEKIACVISGVLLSANSIANYLIALALSIELFVTLRRNQRAIKKNMTLKILNIFLCIIIPWLAIGVGIGLLVLKKDRLFETIPGSGLCTISRHGTHRIALFIVLGLPEFLPIYPAAVLSVATLIPVVKKVFNSRQLTLSVQQKDRSSRRISRGGPPPLSHPNQKIVVPKNVIIRMGLWCSLLIVSGVPTCSILLYRSIKYISTPRHDNSDDANVSRIFQNESGFLLRNEIELKMLISIILFLICFGTGKFAYEHYEKLWSDIWSFLCGRTCFTNNKKNRKKLEFELVLPEEEKRTQIVVQRTKSVASHRLSAFTNSIATDASFAYYTLTSDIQKTPSESKVDLSEIPRTGPEVEFENLPEITYPPSVILKKQREIQF
ncbi:hypothetical protein G9A89_000811 [Geosiphon pyriformis]|nr:hypothetical protein G9A89_000811 [Geosiphon pyriformis]